MNRLMPGSTRIYKSIPELPAGLGLLQAKTKQEEMKL